jgi:hypothetical protein
LTLEVVGKAAMLPDTVEKPPCKMVGAPQSIKDTGRTRGAGKRNGLAAVRRRE